MRKKRESWEQWELDLILEEYPVLGARGIEPLLPRHNYGSISKKAQQLGVTCDVTKQREYLGIKKSTLPKRFFLGRNGYVFYRPEGNTGGILYHRYLMEQHLGRELLPTEIVHHINEDKTDNRLENLELTTRKAHIAHHLHGKTANQDIVRHSEKSESGLTSHGTEGNKNTDF